MLISRSWADLDHGCCREKHEGAPVHAPMMSQGGREGTGPGDVALQGYEIRRTSKVAAGLQHNEADAASGWTAAFSRLSAEFVEIGRNTDTKSGPTLKGGAGSWGWSGTQSGTHAKKEVPGAVKSQIPTMVIE